MNALTLEYAIEQGFTPIDCVKYFNPDWSDEECDFYLWEYTSFPFSMKQVIEELNEKFLSSF